MQWWTISCTAVLHHKNGLIFLTSSVLEPPSGLWEGQISRVLFSGFVSVSILRVDQFHTICCFHYCHKVVTRIDKFQTVFLVLITILKLSWAWIDFVPFSVLITVFLSLSYEWLHLGPFLFLLHRFVTRIGSIWWKRGEGSLGADIQG